jgi:DNA-binding response OmpR family regulator
MAKILIADDERDIVELLKIVLEQDGHKVAAFDHGQKALDEIKRNPYDLLILDIMMPGIDGFSIQLTLQKDEKLKNIPIIIMSALQPAKSLFDSSGQVKAFFVKPFDPKLIVDRVREILA